MREDEDRGNCGGVTSPDARGGGGCIDPDLFVSAKPDLEEEEEEEEEDDDDEVTAPATTRNRFG